MKIKRTLGLPELILVRFFASSEKGLIISDLKKSLKQLLTDFPSQEEWLHQLKQLVEQGSLQMISKTRFIITPQGRQTALHVLGVPSLSVTTPWNTLKSCYLIALILGLPAPSNDKHCQRITSADGLRASILAHTYQLPTGFFPTLSKSRDCLLWQQLTDSAVTTSLKDNLSSLQLKPFTQSSVMTIILNNLLGTTRELSWESALKQLVAKITHAKRIDVEEIRLAILRAGTKINHHSISRPSYLENFAEQVLQAANRCQTGRFGSSKIFISHVWQQLGSEGKQSGLNLKQFKQQLALANNRRLLNLSRADLAQAMNQDDVATSETCYLTATFHFIQLEPNNVR